MKKIYIILFGLLGLHLMLLLKLQFTAWPEMFSFPYMADKGFLIYKDFHHAYQPLLTLILSLVYKLFGFRLLTLEIFTWGIILVSDIVIFAISFNLFGRKLVALLPVAIFVLLQPFLEGNMLWFDLAAIPFILASILFLLKNKFFWSGLLLSLAILTKQQIVLLLPAYFLYLYMQKIKLKDFLSFSAGGITPVLITFITFLSLGIFNDYIFWTLLFPLKYLPKIPGYAMWPAAKQIYILGLLASPLFLLFKRKSWNPEVIFLGILFVGSIGSSFPRFSYFHLQPMAAIYSLLISQIAIPNKKLWLLVLPFLISLYLLKQNLMFFNLPPRFFDSEVKKIAEFVDKEVSKNEKVYLLGPNSLVYVLADRVPPKPWIENYVWHFEIPGMQEKMLTGWKIDPPKIILWSEPTPGNWFDIGTYQPKKIATWIKLNYVKKAEVEPGLWEWRKR